MQNFAAYDKTAQSLLMKILFVLMYEKIQEICLFFVQPDSAGAKLLKIQAIDV